MSETFPALVVQEPGGAFVVERWPRPQPAAGQVLIKIHVSGVNPLDTKIRAGQAAHARQPLPAVLGLDGAGTIVAVGEGVDGLREGHEVYGMLGGVGGHPGTLAELVCVDAQLVARVPCSLSMAEAAALPLGVITAWEGLVDRANVRAGQTVLIHAGASGVGQMAVQIAIARGARVFATVSARKRPVVERLGATPIDYHTTSVEQYVAEHTGGEGFDVVYDTQGGKTLDDSFLAVKKYTGHAVSCLGWGTHALAPLSFRGATYSGVFTLAPLLTGEGRAHHGEILHRAARLADTGQLRPVLHPQTFARDAVDEAHRLVASGAAEGKVVVTL